MYRVSAALALLLAPLPAQAQHWVRIWSSEETRSYLDVDSIRKDGDLIVATTMSAILVPPDGAPKVSWVIWTTEYRCSDRMGHFTRFETLDKDRNSLFAQDDPDQGRYRPALRNDAAASMDYVCGVDRSMAVPVADPFTDNPAKGDR
jgi:hypothetical protein